MTNSGKAYGFFACRRTKQEIETELPRISQAAGMPSELELSLVDGMDNVKGDAKLVELASQAKQIGINYMLEARLPRLSNRQTADNVADILNQAYQTNLYDSGEEFKGEVIFEEAGEYVFRE